MTTESLPPLNSSAGRSSSPAISRMTRIDSASSASRWLSRRSSESVASGAGGVVVVAVGGTGAVRLEPASPEAWRRLGEHYVTTLDQPARAIPVLRGALFLDPTSSLNRGAYLLALRARSLEREEALAAGRAVRQGKRA